MIHIGQLAPDKQWDQNLLSLLFENRLYPTGIDFRRHMGYPNSAGCALLIPGRYWVGQGAAISEAIAPYDWILAIRTGDEADEFDINTVRHRNIKWWVQTPRTDRDYGDARLFGCGFPPHFNDLPEQPPHKGSRVFLSGQNNHPRRQECFTALEGTHQAFVQPTPGFTKGLPVGEYTQMMVDAKIAPAPSGPKTPDTFRVYEALEAHTVPIADDLTPNYDSHGYWRMILPTVPIPVLTDYGCLPGYINDVLGNWPSNANKITVAWMQYKRRLAHWLVDDLNALGAL